jgi:uncharacterized protein with GYD domain
MPTYVLLSRLSPEAFREPSQLKALAEKVSKEIKSQCPEAEWKSSFSLLGRFDVLDVFEAPDEKTAERVSMIIRAYGHSSTETFVARPWKEVLNGL